MLSFVGHGIPWKRPKIGPQVSHVTAHRVTGIFHGNPVVILPPCHEEATLPWQPHEILPFSRNITQTFLLSLSIRKIIQIFAIFVKCQHNRLEIFVIATLLITSFTKYFEEIFRKNIDPKFCVLNLPLKKVAPIQYIYICRCRSMYIHTSRVYRVSPPLFIFIDGGSPLCPVHSSNIGTV